MLLHSQGITQNLHKHFKFQGQFDLEVQGQDYQFSNQSGPFRCSINSSRIKFKTFQRLTVKIKIFELRRPI